MDCSWLLIKRSVARVCNGTNVALGDKRLRARVVATLTFSDGLCQGPLIHCCESAVHMFAMKISRAGTYAKSGIGKIWVVVRL